VTVILLPSCKTKQSTFHDRDCVASRRVVSVNNATAVCQLRDWTRRTRLGLFGRSTTPVAAPTWPSQALAIVEAAYGPPSRRRDLAVGSASNGWSGIPHVSLADQRHFSPGSARLELDWQAATKIWKRHLKEFSKCGSTLGDSLLRYLNHYGIVD